ncbi:fibroblast growth factor 23-like isoform X2 [Sander lucioperca]|uniref:fibroblast growth factor 23-like isoform X2 n=1 Tax=Sander lucioperca TaxID=283035 RepID=UPI001653EA09|nr:fibroblast growth factor 23-like isoform X2 [Sander lucioperca]
MQPAFFSLILIAVHVSVPVDCAPALRDPEQLVRRRQSSFHTGAHADASAVILPVRRDTSNYVSIFDLRRKRYLCVDSKGEQYNSRQTGPEDCLFEHIWLDLANHHDVFYSISGGRLLKVEEAEPSSALAFLGPLVKRQRRSERVNPSDPFRSQSHPSHSAKHHWDADGRQREQDQVGAVSKETITSCDDPLRVLQSNGPVSPVKTNIADRAEQD